MLFRHLITWPNKDEVKRDLRSMCHSVLGSVPVFFFNFTTCLIINSKFRLCKRLRLFIVRYI